MRASHREHLLDAVCSTLKLTQIVVGGIDAFSAQKKISRSPYLMSRIEAHTTLNVIFYNTHDPYGCAELMSDMFGPYSKFERKFGYCLNPTVSFDALLPTGWTQRITSAYGAFSKSGHQTFCIDAHDVALSNMIFAPDPLMDMALALQCDLLVSRLHERLELWADRLTHDQYEQGLRYIGLVESVINDLGEHLSIDNSTSDAWVQTALYDHALDQGLILPTPEQDTREWPDNVIPIIQSSAFRKKA